MAQRGLQTTLTVPGKRFVAGNGGLETAGLLVGAGKKMAEEGLSMRELYPAFLEVCIEQDLSFFSGKSKLKFDTD